MNRLEALQQIAARAASGEITLPPGVNAALRLQQALDDPDCHMEAAITLVAGEPQLAARVVALANSAAFNRGGDSEVTGVRAAVMRVGYKSLKTLVASLVVKQMGARINDPALRQKAERLWLHTANVAALAHVLARRITQVDPDTAMFVGITHEVGNVYLLSRAEEFPALLEGTLDAAGAALEEQITREVLRQLSLPEPVSQAILAARARNLGDPPSSLADTLVLANQFALVESPLGQPDHMPEPDESELDFVVDSAKLTKIIAESTDELRSVIAALMV